jgi:hypothetical protein
VGLGSGWEGFSVVGSAREWMGEMGKIG